MRINRVRAEQVPGSAPEHSYMPRGIFSRDITIPEPVLVNDNPPDDGGGHSYPGATAQNGFTEVLFYRCNLCGATVRESDLEGHSEQCR